jgi:hypothetical protein
MISKRALFAVLSMLAVSLFVPGCANFQAQQVQALGAADLRCSTDRVSVYTTRSVWPATDYVARGCGKWAEYECVLREDGAQRCSPRLRADVHPEANAAQ